MITPPAPREYRPKVSTVSPRASRPLPPLCSHLAPKETCTQCRAPLPPERGVERQHAEHEAVSLLAKLDARRTKARKRKGMPAAPKTPRGLGLVKNGYDEHGKQRWRDPKPSRARTTPERRAELLTIARAASVAARKAKEEQITIPDGRTLPVSEAARALGLRPQTVWRRRNYQRMTARQALRLDPVIAEAAE